MIEAFYRQTAEVEERQWWFVHRRALVASLIRRYAPGRLQRVLDLGCGTGGNAPLLASIAGVVVGLDRSPLALELARGKTTPSLLVRGDANHVASTFAPASFDLVLAGNVLYHEWIRDVRRVLEGVRTVLTEGGCLVWTEPAFPSLARRHDRVDLGIRRFRMGEIRRLLTDAGFEVRFASHFNVVSFVPALGVALADRWKGEGSRPVDADKRVGEIDDPPRLVDRLVRGACRVERAAVTRGVAMPFGVGLIALAGVPRDRAD